MFVEFITANIELFNYEFLYSLYHTGIMPESIFIAVLFCELGSFKKIFFDLHFDVVDFESYNELLKSVAPQNTPKYLQFGLETLKKCKE